LSSRGGGAPGHGKEFRSCRGEADRIKDIEHKGDDMVHTIASALNKTFVTPIDHDDISELTSRLDDILDFIEAASHRLWSYEIRTIRRTWSSSRRSY